MFKMDKLFDMGLDTALFITPYHWRRSPFWAYSGSLYLDHADAPMTLENLGRCMHDLRSAWLLLKSFGADEIGLVGGSLGGYHIALYSCLQGDHAFGVMTVPAVDLVHSADAANFGLAFQPDEELRRDLRQVWSIHAPLSHLPQIDRERLLLVAARGDNLCPLRYAERLRRKWRGMNCRFVSGGHWLLMDRKERGAAWYEFLKERGFID